MKKQSLFLSLVLGLLGTPLLADYCVTIDNQSKNPAAIDVGYQIMLDSKNETTLNLKSTQHVRITTKKGIPTTLPALPNVMITDERGIYRPREHGYNVTIDSKGNISVKEFKE